MFPAEGESTETFPTHGARARLLARFERDFRSWLDTADGRFAVWLAREPCWVQAARRRQASRDETVGRGGSRSRSA